MGSLMSNKLPSHPPHEVLQALVICKCGIVELLLVLKFKAPKITESLELDLMNTPNVAVNEMASDLKYLFAILPCYFIKIRR
jgi:hypothetical protein